MTEKEFRQEFENLSEEVSVNSFRDSGEKLFDHIKSHGKPIIVFGAGVATNRITWQLKKHNVDVTGYAVDAEYYSPNQTCHGRPVFNFNEIVKKADDYVFVCGMGIPCGYRQDIEKINVAVKRKKQFIDDSRITKYVAFYKRDWAVDYEFLMKNYDKFFETYNYFSDDLSRKTMIAYLKTSIKDDISPILDVFANDEYFNDLTDGFLNGGGGGYVDCGAYVGDSIEQFVEWCGGRYTKIFAFEPDEKSFLKLEKFVREKNYQNVELFNCGVWKEKTTLSFKGFGHAGSYISDEGNISIKADAIDNVVGDTPIGYIKMDVEGSELHALQGAVNTIKKFNPILAVCVYHRPEDLITIPQFVKTLGNEYNLYLRQHDPNNLLGLDLYCIPK